MTNVTSVEISSQLPHCSHFWLACEGKYPANGHIESVGEGGF